MMTGPFCSRRSRAAAGVGAAILVLAGIRPAPADDFVRVRYDPATDQLVLTMRYQGTNAHHGFSLQWGQCKARAAGLAAQLPGRVLDDQAQDPAQSAFVVTTRIGLADMPCRPAKVTLWTAPRFFYVVMIPPPP
jgi:hypothetical protein